MSSIAPLSQVKVRQRPGRGMTLTLASSLGHHQQHQQTPGAAPAILIVSPLLAAITLPGHLDVKSIFLLMFVPWTPAIVTLIKYFNNILCASVVILPPQRSLYHK